MEGRGDHILLPSVIPAQVQGRHNTMRSTHTIGHRSNANAVRPVRRALGIPSRLWRPWGKTPAWRSVHRLGAQRDLELVNSNSILNADADQVPVTINYLMP